MKNFLKYTVLKILDIRLNTKKKDFFISNIIIVVFTILIVLVVNFFLITLFGFNQSNFYPITIFLVLLGVAVYYFLNRSLINEFFKSEEKLKEVIKETLHELNTPVATIELNSKMLKNKLNDEKSKQRLERIDSACNDLLELYEEMEYEIKEHIHHITKENFELKEIVEKSMKRFDDLKKDIDIEYDGNSTTLYSDKNGFLKMVDNLLSNGIKYNKPQGKITISFEGNTLQIADSGEGIDTKNLFSVFDKYYQENTLNSGIGLGLNIVKKYCDEHKIMIKIDSQKDEGTTFSFNLKNIMKDTSGS